MEKHLNILTQLLKWYWINKRNRNLDSFSELEKQFYIKCYIYNHLKMGEWIGI